LEIELHTRSIPFKAQQELAVYYKGQRLKKFYIADIVAYEKIVIELKAIEKLMAIEEAQLLNELKATGLELGLLINFGASKELDWLRRVMSHKSDRKTR
jgi:GxxExxY protein